MLDEQNLSRLRGLRLMIQVFSYQGAALIRISPPTRSIWSHLTPKQKTRTHGFRAAVHKPADDSTVRLHSFMRQKDNRKRHEVKEEGGRWREKEEHSQPKTKSQLVSQIEQIGLTSLRPKPNMTFSDGEKTQTPRPGKDTSVVPNPSRQISSCPRSDRADHAMIRKVSHQTHKTLISRGGVRG